VVGRWPAPARGRRASGEIAGRTSKGLTTGLELMLLDAAIIA
jgi:hypothetical protein